MAFADQDDVWLPDKLQRALAFLNSVEDGRPALYCGRQRLVDESLQPLGFSPSFRASGIPGLVLQNVGTGCTMVMNRAAAAAVHVSEKPSARARLVGLHVCRGDRRGRVFRRYANDFVPAARAEHDRREIFPMGWPESGPRARSNCAQSGNLGSGGGFVTKWASPDARGPAGSATNP